MWTVPLKEFVRDDADFADSSEQIRRWYGLT
jgi:hypothetical protein